MDFVHGGKTKQFDLIEKKKTKKRKNKKKKNPNKLKRNFPKKVG